jgi:hypothetical protein
MYNLTVEQLHTYYVLAGATPVLVHNSDCSEPIAVIGSHTDTQVAQEWLGHEVLVMPQKAWTLAKNDAWVNGVIESGRTVYVGSPMRHENLWDVVHDRPTVLAREIGMFTDAGYSWSGSYLIPPTK